MVATRIIAMLLVLSLHPKCAYTHTHTWWNSHPPPFHCLQMEEFQVSLTRVGLSMQQVEGASSCGKFWGVQGDGGFSRPFTQSLPQPPIFVLSPLSHEWFVSHWSGLFTRADLNKKQIIPACPAFLVSCCETGNCTLPDFSAWGTS